MKDEQLVEALREKNEAWRHADENKPVDCCPRPLVAMLDAVFRTLVEQRQEIKMLNGTINFLAECHAANAECPPKGLSKYNRRRFRSILEKAVDLITGQKCPSHNDLVRDRDALVTRCKRAAEELGV